MLEQPSKRIIQALANLEADKDFQDIVDWMTHSLEQLKRDVLNTKDEVQTRWYQGGGQVLEEFLKKANEARETIRKF